MSSFATVPVAAAPQASAEIEVADEAVARAPEGARAATLHGARVGRRLAGRILADALSLSRLPLAALILFGETRDWAAVAFFLFLAMDSSDLLDGYIARRFGCASPKGAALDAGMDFAALFALVAFGGRPGLFGLPSLYGLFLPALMAASFGSFALRCLLRGQGRSRIGRFSGAILYAALTVEAGARALLPCAATVVEIVGRASSALILSISVAENLAALWRRPPGCVAKNRNKISETMTGSDNTRMYPAFRSGKAGLKNQSEVPYEQNDRRLRPGLRRLPRLHRVHDER